MVSGQAEASHSGRASAGVMRKGAKLRALKWGEMMVVRRGEELTTVPKRRHQFGQGLRPCDQTNGRGK